MASRKDQLNAYTFARKRTVAAFLQPSPSGSEEGAPRPLRTVLPTCVVGALVVVVFGAWGLIKPSAPQGWSEPGKNVIVGSESTTRYVVLETDGKKQLHPVLNLASARLLLDSAKYQVIKVKESVLDSGKIPHGATIGIPYAPDRLPSADEAGKAKKWAVCERPGAGSGADAVDRAVFVLAGSDSDVVDDAHRITGEQALYVTDKKGAEYLVDPAGTRFLIGGKNWSKKPPARMELLRRTLFGQGARPQLVSDEWLASLNEGAPLVFPQVPGYGTQSKVHVPGLDFPNLNVGMVLQTTQGRVERYVVLDDSVQPISELVARLLLSSEEAMSIYPDSNPRELTVPQAAITPDPTVFAGNYHWPKRIPTEANSASKAAGSRNVSCSVYRGSVDAQGRPNLSVWAGTSYPAQIVDGASSAYVTPGSGLLFKELTGKNTGGGSLYLVTDTGLRYSVPSNNDTEAKNPVTGSTSGGSDQQNSAQQQANQAQIRLGYANVTPLPAPRNWSGFLPKGPTLDTSSAAQPQGS